MVSLTERVQTADEPSHVAHLENEWRSCSIGTILSFSQNHPARMLPPKVPGWRSGVVEVAAILNYSQSKTVHNIAAARVRDFLMNTTGGSFRGSTAVATVVTPLQAENCALSGLSSAVSGESAGAVIRRDLLFDQELEDYMTIYDIYQQYGMGTKWELRLQYHFSDSIVNGVAQFVSSGAQG
jgi:hypothetical protein